MDASRTYVANGESKVPSQFALYIEVPLHHVVARRDGLNIRRAQGSSSQLGKSAGGKRTGSGFIRSCQVERRSTKFDVKELVDEREHVKHAETGANRGLSVVKGSQANPTRGSKLRSVGFAKKGSPV